MKIIKYTQEAVKFIEFYNLDVYSLNIFASGDICTIVVQGMKSKNLDFYNKFESEFKEDTNRFNEYCIGNIRLVLDNE